MRAIYLWTIIFATVPTVVAQKNLAPEGKPRQSSMYLVCGPDSAITGNATHDWSWNYESCTCTHTQHNKAIAWWRDDFDREVYITNLTMYFRDFYGPDLYGFEFYVTNSSLIPPPNEDLCYRDKGNSTHFPNVYQEIRCNTIGRSVVFYISRPHSAKPRAYVLMCYLEINGCWKSMWGSNCSKHCPATCINQHCHPENGSCVWGCRNDNCLDGSCNASSYVCTDGCSTGQFGRYCDKNYRNIALNNTATQFPNDGSPARHAVDGNRTTDTCAKAVGSVTWLQIDLGGLSIITNIYVTFGGSTQNVRNHTIYATNTSASWSDGRLLYQGTRPQHDIQVLAVSKYVIYVPQAVNDVSQLNVCEMEIGGCLVGKFGPNCNRTCPKHCGGPCDIDTGSCIFGCMDGWLGDKCDKACEDGYYGNKCTERCYCSVICDKATGNCNGDCDAGWKGITCDEECASGYYGTNCGKQCDHCYNSQCDRFDGICSRGCNEGYTGYSCIISVKSNYSLGIVLGLSVGCFVIGILLTLATEIFVMKLRMLTGQGKENDNQEPTYDSISMKNTQTFKENQSNLEHTYTELTPSTGSNKKE